jgi:hypothetical protein
MSHDIEAGAPRKEMILIYASQLDYEGMAGQATDLPAWSPEDFATMGAVMEAFNGELVESGEIDRGTGGGCAGAFPVQTRGADQQRR